MSWLSRSAWHYAVMAQLISINLLPPELIVTEKEKKPLFKGMPSWSVIVPVAVGVVLAVHLYLGTILMIKGNRLKKLDGEWESLTPQRQTLEQFDSRYASLTKQMSIAQRMANDRILWAPKLHLLSKDLPMGIWFREIEISQSDFILHGTVIAMDREEISLIRQFVDSLNREPGFMKDFTSFELRSVQKRTIVYHDVSDFILVGSLRSKS